MAIATSTAILGAAAIGAGASVLGASGQKKAAKKAANAEIAMARENNALAQQFRAENTANFAPWMQSGTRGNALVDSFLYGPAPADYHSAPQQQTPQTNPVAAQEPLLAESELMPTASGGPLAQWAAMNGGEAGGAFHLGSGMKRGGYQAPVWQPQQPVQQPVNSALMPQQPQGQPSSTPMSGYNAFVNSPYYQFPLQEGYRALNHGLASRGMLESGDAAKSAIRYGQDYGYGRMGEFIGLAERQSDRGLTGASAIAGVNTNALASMGANNRAIGDANANRYIAGGVANANMWSGIGSAIGGALGSFGQSSYGGGGYGGYGRAY